MNVLVKYSLLSLVGLAAGLIAGGLGTSTAYALILGLVVTGVSKDYKHAAALTLFTILPPLSLGAVYTYYKKNMIDIPAGLFLMVVCFFSAWAGSKLNAYIPDYIAELLLGVFLLIVSLYMFNRSFANWGKKQGTIKSHIVHT